ncbi:formate transporter [Thermococcus sp. P6]|uniref:formate/nitrite transporter family protein n=1 Tax=Thermococcus sp. P6 TaxID=122420 RepID=UPI000B5989CA|nr:formate/nitrite transporter family protein [Thermococcus sp. P6]ASJ10027.1 formate transporter [Thermococcus sp. P6]
MEDKSTPILYNVHEGVDACSGIGYAKTRAPPSKLLFAGFMAGAYIAFGFMLAIVAGASFHPKLGTLPNTSLFKLLLGAVFPVGLIAVLLGGADLWTGNTQIVSISKLTGKVEVRDVLYNWIGSYAGNFMGSVFLAFLAVYGTGLFGGGLFRDVLVGIGTYKVNLTPWKAFWLAVGCNWLVNVAIWLYVRAKDTAGKILATWFPIFAFVAIGFEHSIANMWAITSTIFASDYSVTWVDFFKNVIPVTVGNAVGGFFFVGFYHWYLADGERALKEILDFLELLLIFTVLMTLIPAGIAYLLNGLGKAALWAVPAFIILYGAGVTHAVWRGVCGGGSKCLT